MFWSDDPVRDAEAYEAEIVRAEEKLPKCGRCKKPIQSEECYAIDDMLVCPSCLEKHYQKWTEDFID